MMGRSVYLDQKGETKVKDPVSYGDSDPVYNDTVLDSGPYVTITSESGLGKGALRIWGTYGVKFEDANAPDGWQLISWAEIDFYRERYSVKAVADELAEETTLG